VIVSAAAFHDPDKALLHVATRTHSSACHGPLRQNSDLQRVTKFKLSGSERRFKDLHFRTTKQCKKIYLSLISLFEHKLDNNFGTEGGPLRAYN
jgi:hypothetical protein